MKSNFSVKPIRSDSSLFYERYAKAELSFLRSQKVVFLLSGLCVVLALSLGSQALIPKPVYYIPGAVLPGVALPGNIPESSVSSFVIFWLMNWLNYTPETIENGFVRARKWMTPRFLSKAYSRSIEEIEKVRQDRLSSMFVLEREPDVKHSSDGFLVTVSGRRGIYIGKEEMSWNNVVFKIRLLRQSATEDNPYGLGVAEIIRE